MNGFGQIKALTNDGCNELITKNKDYFFRINGEDYFDKDKIFICSNELDLIIDVYKVNKNAPPTLLVEETSWENAQKDGTHSYRGIVKKEHLNSKNEVKVKSIFEINGQDVKLSIKISINLWFEIFKRSRSI